MADRSVSTSGRVRREPSARATGPQSERDERLIEVWDADAWDDDQPDGMPRTIEEAWEEYFEAHPEVLASWRQQNGYWPMED